MIGTTHYLILGLAFYGMTGLFWLSGWLPTAIDTTASAHKRWNAVLYSIAVPFWPAAALWLITRRLRVESRAAHARRAVVVAHPVGPRVRHLIEGDSSVNRTRVQRPAHISRHAQVSHPMRPAKTASRTHARR